MNDGLNLVLSKLGDHGLRKSGRGWSARCPAHDDSTASLSVTEGTDQPVVLHCHAGCDTDDILRAVGLTWAEVCAERPKPASSEPLAVYDYVDEAGTLLFQVVRLEGKQFRQRRPDGKGGWTWSLGDTRRVLYRLPELVAAVAEGRPVWICEGEKDADALIRAGEVATCNPGGAGKWRPEFNDVFAGGEVLIVADRDTPGRRHAAAVATALRPVVNKLWCVEPVEGKDVADHLAAGHGVDAFEIVADEWQNLDDAPADDDPGPAEPDAPRQHDPTLVIEDVAAIVARVDAMPAPTFLARPVWPADAYGMIGAENKAGKTWAILDLAVTVAAGKDWLGQYPCERPGTVVLFLGEGGERKTIRRLRAVCNFYDVRLENLPIRICHRVPQLTTPSHISVIRDELEQQQPVAVVVDPLYLAAKGAKGSQLFEMAAVFEPVQLACQEFGAALVVVHHWNQTGQGKGRERFSGAGSAEWGRVLASVSVESRRTDDDGASLVTLAWQFIGDEIPDTELRVLRRVHAEDLNDLASPMTYEVDLADVIRSENDGEWDGPTQCMDAVEHLLRETGMELTKSKVREELRDRGQRFRNETVGRACEQLVDAGRLSVRPGPRKARLFRIPGEGTQDELAAS